MILFNPSSMREQMAGNILKKALQFQCYFPSSCCRENEKLDITDFIVV